MLSCLDTGYHDRYQSAEHIKDQNGKFSTVIHTHYHLCDSATVFPLGVISWQYRGPFFSICGIRFGYKMQQFSFW